MFTFCGSWYWAEAFDSEFNEELVVIGLDGAYGVRGIGIIFHDVLGVEGWGCSVAP